MPDTSPATSRKTSPPGDDPIIRTRRSNASRGQAAVDPAVDPGAERADALLGVAVAGLVGPRVVVRDRLQGLLDLLVVPGLDADQPFLRRALQRGAGQA